MTRLSVLLTISLIDEVHEEGQEVVGLLNNLWKTESPSNFH